MFIYSQSMSSNPCLECSHTTNTHRKLYVSNGIPLQKVCFPIMSPRPWGLILYLQKQCPSRGQFESLFILKEEKSTRYRPGKNCRSCVSSCRLNASSHDPVLLRCPRKITVAFPSVKKNGIVCCTLIISLFAWLTYYFFIQLETQLHLSNYHIWKKYILSDEISVILTLKMKCKEQVNGICFSWA